ncbi:Uncharacterised protein [Dermatophilus congolensis]|uniref:Uncharacterized protein n=1 Tax=Dermatophilus congolensis TaxID=1863 RepID=A0AA46BQC4_9MICO|nr:Uncharacterised protein [Dermatophilus congolensis]
MGHPFSYGRGPVREPLPFFNEQMWCGCAAVLVLPLGAGGGVCR